MKRKMSAGLMLVGVLAAAAPSYAANGADDTASTGGTAGSAGTAGTSGTAGSDDLFQAPGIHSRVLNATVGGVQGHIEHVLRPRRNREDISVEVALKLGKRVRAKAARHAVIAAEFPDGSRCDLDFDRKDKGIAYYELHVKSKNGVFTQVHGSCDTAALPSVAGTVTIVHDRDDDRATPDTELLHRHL